MPTSLISLLLIFSLPLPGGHSSTANPVEFYFDNFTAAATNNSVTLYGSAALINNGIVQLTNTTSNVTAHLFYSTPIPFKNPNNQTNATATATAVHSFSTAFTFAMVPKFQQLGSHGMAFTISATNNLTSALPNEYLGLFNTSTNGATSSHIFAVEFDSVRNFEFGDIDDNHVGIDLNSLISNYSVPAAYYTDTGERVNVTLKSRNTYQAWVDFDSATSILNVTISPTPFKPKFPLISRKLDLSLIMENFMYVGFSCATGLLSSSHYVLGWSFNTTGPARSLPITKPPLPNVHNSHQALALALIASFSFVLVITLSLYLIRRRRNADVIEPWEKTIGPHRYSYKEIKTATNGFGEKELLGRGGFGRVYKGVMNDDKTLVAIKRVSHESRQGLREFMAEIDTIGRVRHRNVVHLHGWCRRRDDLMLVYDYMPNGSLDKYLFGEPQLAALTWEQRVNVIKGVASGLLYLHEGWEQVVIHRDVKSSNVLLDGGLNPRLGDFGLARMHDHDADLTTTRVVGTLGYIAPELSKTGKATTSTDVFAFGTLLLEVVCGRRPIEPKAAQEELVLVDWVWEKWARGDFRRVVDTRLGGRFDEEEVELVLRLGLMCACYAPHARPGMRQVVGYLKGEMELPEGLPATPPGGGFESSEAGLESTGSWREGEVCMDVEEFSCRHSRLISSDHITSVRW